MPCFKARYVFPVSRPPVRDGIVSCDHVVHSLTENLSGEPIVDLGNVAILPALVNAHTHLELSHFQQPIGDPAHGFPAWIREVVRWRRQQTATLSPEEIEQQRHAAIQDGLLESVRGGVGVVADITSLGPAPPLPQLPTRIAFAEVLGLSTARENELYETAEQAVGPWPKAEALSPHAPYTVGVPLLTRLAQLSAERGFPLAMHLAESVDELELMRSHSGAFYTMLSEVGAWDPAALPRGIAPLDYLKILAQAQHALVIHGNYLNSAEIDYLAEQSERLSVVYCPRTHAYFGHTRYPLLEMFRKGVKVAVGTDSRASNPDLKLWDELRYVAQQFPEVPLEVILKMGTLWGAQALRGALGSPSCGELVPGALALLQIVDLPEDEVADPYELLFDPRAKVRQVIGLG